MINLLNSISSSDVSLDPMILTGAILMAAGIVVPCLIWFVRNVYRVFAKKDFWWLNKTLKISWLIGIVVFIVGLILLVIKLSLGA